jgi:hypothetical protein
VLVTSAYAAQVSFAWDAPVGGGATGYKLYCGSATGVYGAPVDVPGATLTKTLTLNGGPNFCAVTAYNAVAESAKSNEVSVPLPPGAPPNLRFTVTLAWDDAKGIYVAKVGKVSEIP